MMFFEKNDSLSVSIPLIHFSYIDMPYGDGVKLLKALIAMALLTATRRLLSLVEFMWPPKWVLLM